MKNPFTLISATEIVAMGLILSSGVLQAEGMIFDRHYDTKAICMASRANILTGMYEYETGTNFEHRDRKPETRAQSDPVLEAVAKSADRQKNKNGKKSKRTENQQNN